MILFSPEQRARGQYGYNTQVAQIPFLVTVIEAVLVKALFV